MKAKSHLAKIANLSKELSDAVHDYNYPKATEIKLEIEKEYSSIDKVKNC